MISRGSWLVAAAAAIGATVLSGCGSSGGSGGATTTTVTMTTTIETTATTPTTADTATPGSLTPVGSTLKMGQAAVIRYDDATAHATTDLEVTPEPIEQGSIDDFKNIQLDDNQKTATPFYVKLKVKNVGKGDLSGSEPGSYIDGVDDRGQIQNEVIFFGGFARCPSVQPKHFKPGDSYETCLTYLIPKGGSIVGMRWIAFDQKTGKSDINWK
jgi:hypothetical protein